MTMLGQPIADTGSSRSNPITRARCQFHPEEPLRFGGFDGLASYVTCQKCPCRIYLCGEKHGSHTCSLPASHFQLGIDYHMSSSGHEWRYVKGEKYKLDVEGLADLCLEQARLSRREQELLASNSGYRERAQAAEQENDVLRRALGFYASDYDDGGRIARKALGMRNGVLTCECVHCGEFIVMGARIREDKRFRVGLEIAHLTKLHLEQKHGLEPSAEEVAEGVKVTFKPELTISGEEVQIPVSEEPPAAEETQKGGNESGYGSGNQGNL